MNKFFIGSKSTNNIIKTRASTSGNLAIGQASSGNPNMNNCPL